MSILVVIIFIYGVFASCDVVTPQITQKCASNCLTAENTCLEIPECGADGIQQELDLVPQSTIYCANGCGPQNGKCLETVQCQADGVRIEYPDVMPQLTTYCASGCGPQNSPCSETAQCRANVTFVPLNRTQHKCTSRCYTLGQCRTDNECDPTKLNEFDPETKLCDSQPSCIYDDSPSISRCIPVTVDTYCQAIDIYSCPDGFHITDPLMEWPECDRYNQNDRCRKNDNVVRIPVYPVPTITEKLTCVSDCPKYCHYNDTYGRCIPEALTAYCQATSLLKCPTGYQFNVTIDVECSIFNQNIMCNRGNGVIQVPVGLDVSYLSCTKIVTAPSCPKNCQYNATHDRCIPNLITNYCQSISLLKCPTGYQFNLTLDVECGVFNQNMMCNRSNGYIQVPANLDIRNVSCAKINRDPSCPKNCQYNATYDRCIPNLISNYCQSITLVKCSSKHQLENQPVTNCTRFNQNEPCVRDNAWIQFPIELTPQNLKCVCTNSASRHIYSLIYIYLMLFYLW
jgi:hypothetical protein